MTPATAPAALRRRISASAPIIATANLARD
jgi:hypothetical protein